MNAVRHGLAARAALLPGEDAAELDQLAREMEADLRPRGTMQRELIGRIVSLSWRLRRVARAEETLWAQDDDDRMEEHHNRQRLLGMLPHLAALRRDDGTVRPARSGVEFIAKQFSGTQGYRGTASSGIERLAVYEQRLDRALHAALRQLQQLRKMRDAEEEDERGDDAPQRPVPAPAEVAEPAADAQPLEAIAPNEPTDARRVMPRMASAGAAQDREGTVRQRSDAPTADTIRGFTLHDSTNDANAQNEPTADAPVAPVRLHPGQTG